MTTVGYVAATFDESSSQHTDSFLNAEVHLYAQSIPKASAMQSCMPCP